MLISFKWFNVRPMARPKFSNPKNGGQFLDYL